MQSEENQANTKSMHWTHRILKITDTKSAVMNISRKTLILCYFTLSQFKNNWLQNYSTKCSTLLPYGSNGF